MNNPTADMDWVPITISWPDPVRLDLQHREAAGSVHAGRFVDDEEEDP